MPSELYAALDADERPSHRRDALARSRAGRRLIPLALATAAFVAGVALDASLFHLGDHGRAASVVIGQRIIRESPVPPRTVPHPPTNTSASLSWSLPLLVDASGALRSISCTSSTFCAAVDGHGQALLFTGGQWSPPERIDGSSQINSISCTGPTWCAAVDQAGNAMSYDGSRWSAPQRIDATQFPELTSVSCASPTFCAAVDGKGNALVYNGGRWSPPVQVDPLGWSPVSRDVPSVSCPSEGSCVGVDPENNAFFYEADAWQPAASINPSSSGGPAVKSPNAVSCASVVFCVATDNLGDVEAFDGTQWSVPVTTDAANYLATISCPSTSFCAAVDSLLPAGFNTGSGGGSGQVVTYNGVSWSTPRPMDDEGLVASISCPTAQFCAAVDASGHVVTGAIPSSPGPPG